MLPVIALGTSQVGRVEKLQLYPGVPPVTAQTVEYCVPDATEPVGARQPNFSTDVVAMLIVMVCEAVCGVGRPLSVTVAMRL